MKRLVLSAVAAALLAFPVAQAQAGPRHEQRYEQQWNKPFQGKHERYGKHDRYQKKVVKKRHWQRGQRVPSWQRHHVVKDYHRYGLRRPGHGQHWVRVDNDFLLISIASGLIGGIIASQF